MQNWKVALTLRLGDPAEERGPDAPGAWSETFDVQAPDKRAAGVEALRRAYLAYDDMSGDANLFVRVVSVTPQG